MIILYNYIDVKKGIDYTNQNEMGLSEKLKLNK
jgi:hypothetical protein